MKCIDCKNATTKDEHGNRLDEYARVGLVRCILDPGKRFSDPKGMMTGNIKAMFFSARYERECESFSCRKKD